MRSKGTLSLYGVVNNPLKNKKSLQILPKSWNLAQPTNGSQSLRFCFCRSHICFSIKSQHFSVLASDFKIPVSVSWWVSDLPFSTPFIQHFNLPHLNHYLTWKSDKGWEWSEISVCKLYISCYTSFRDISILNAFFFLVQVVNSLEMEVLMKFSFTSFVLFKFKTNSLMTTSVSQKRTLLRYWKQG